MKVKTLNTQSKLILSSFITSSWHIGSVNIFDGAWKSCTIHIYLNSRVKYSECVSFQAAAGNIINMLWQLMENGLEELKLLQTVLVLLTTNTVVHDEVLSKVPPI